jgi:hypothetical protein
MHFLFHLLVSRHWSNFSKSEVTPAISPQLAKGESPDVAGLHNENDFNMLTPLLIRPDLFQLSGLNPADPSDLFRVQPHLHVLSCRQCR